MDIFSSLISLIESYGWYMLLFGIIFVYVYHKVLKSRIEEYKKRRDQEEYASKYHKNPDLFVARQIAQQEAAMRLQEKYRKDVEEHQKKMEEREAKKRDEIMEKYVGSGHKLGGSDNKTRSFKPGYNPLMGSGSGSTYRAPRRTPCSQGGCG